jgi:hypothetical protein
MVAKPGAEHTVGMVTALAAGRARSDIDVLSRAGLPLADFMEESAAALLSVIPFVAGCFSSTDPATSMISSTHKLGDLHGRNDADVAWARIEYGGEPDPTHYDEMASAGNVAVGIHAATGGQVDRLERMADLVVPRFGYVDEARVVFADRAGVWATLSILRGSDDAVFDAGELQLLTDIAPALTRGIRTGLLSQLARREAVHPTGPAVLIIDARIASFSRAPARRNVSHSCPRPGRTPSATSRRWSAARAASPRARSPGCHAPARARPTACGWCCTPRRSAASATAPARWS